MSQSVTDYNAGGSFTFTTSPYLLNGSISLQLYGANGAGDPPTNGGKAGFVSGTVATSPSTSFTVYVGDSSTHGYHTGGAGSAAGNSGAENGYHGGGSSAFLTGSTPLLEAGGGGGGGGQAKIALGSGHGGAGGLPQGSGGNGFLVSIGSGDPYGGGGGGGGGHQGNGSGGQATNTGFGGTGAGEGGDSGAIRTNQAGSGGGGCGGTSYAAASVSNPRFSNGVGGTQTGAVVVTQTVADPPLTPTLNRPTNGYYADTGALSITFAWTYNPGTDSGTQNAYALRISTDGGAYQYWNGSALTGTETWITSPASSVGLPAGTLADGHTYTWSVATQESHYSLQGPFATDSVFYGTAMPTATITAPLSTTSSATPAVSWSETLGGGDSQTSYQACIYLTSLTTAPGFVPGTTPGANMNTGQVSSAATSVAFTGTALTPGNYTAYVQIVETGSVASVWASQAFTVAFDQPATPSITAVAGTSTPGAPMVTLTVTTNENQLSSDDGSFEATIGSAAAGTNCTVAQSSTQALDGSFSLALTSSAAGNMTATLGSGWQYAVSPSQQYTAVADFRPGTTARTVAVDLSWYNASHTLISTTSGTGASDATGVWTQVTNTASAPALAAFVVVQLRVVSTAGASEVHYVDEVGFFNGSQTTWTRGGLLGLDTLNLTYTDDGTDWFPLRGGSAISVPSATQSLTIVDYEAKVGIQREYQAVIQAAVTTPVTATINSPAAVAYATVLSTGWVLSDPLDPTTVLTFNRLGTSGSTSNMFETTAANVTNLQVPVSFEVDTSEQMGVFYGWGNPDPIIQRGTVLAPTMTVAGWIQGYSQFQTWQSLVGRIPWQNGEPRQNTLLLRSDMGDAWYVVVGPGTNDQVLRAPDRIANPMYVITIACTVTSAP